MRISTFYGEPFLQCRTPGFDPWVQRFPRKRAWQPTPVFLPGEFHGQRSLAGHSLWGCKELDTSEQLTLTHSCAPSLVLGICSSCHSEVALWFPLYHTHWLTLRDSTGRYGSVWSSLHALPPKISATKANKNSLMKSENQQQGRAFGCWVFAFVSHTSCIPGRMHVRANWTSVGTRAKRERPGVRVSWSGCGQCVHAHFRSPLQDLVTYSLDTSKGEEFLSKVGRALKCQPFYPPMTVLGCVSWHGEPFCPCSWPTSRESELQF